jgi:hypothetical protein
MGQYAAAEEFLGQCLADCPRTSGIEIHALAGLGHVACIKGDVGQSRRCIQSALAVAMDAGRVIEAMAVLIEWGRLMIGESEPVQAVELLGFVLHHPATRHAARGRAQELLGELRTELPPDVFDAAMARGRARDLEEVASQVLAEEEGPCS